MNSGEFFVPEIENIHPAWYLRWGESIGSEALADEMFNNPRLQRRVYEQVLRAGDLQFDARFNPNEIACLIAYADDREKLERICGLVVYGTLLRENVTKDRYEQILKQIPLEDLRIAVGLREHHIADVSHSIDVDKVKELAQRTGRSCLSLWKNNLSIQMKIRIAYMDVPSDIDANEREFISPEEAGKIVTSVANLIVSAGAERMAA